MGEVTLNYTAILGAAAAAILLGFLWYGPIFGKYWMKLMGFSKADMEKAKKGMGKRYAIMVVGTLVGAYVMAHFVDYLSASTAKEAGMVGFWLWLGFVAPVTLGSVLWEGKSWSLWILNNAYQLVMLKMMAIILTLWV